MGSKKKKSAKQKLKLHPRNKHRGRYNLQELVVSCPELAPFIITNQYEMESIDFANPESVKMLNKALLIHYYSIEYWDIPSGYLCPPIPGRADYIHHIAEMLGGYNKGKEIPTGEKVRCLDIGVGANCVYPIIGNKEYGWSFVGTEIDDEAFSAASKIIDSNPALAKAVTLRKQGDPSSIFKGIILSGEQFDLTICNPPFHASAQEARNSALRKVRNLTEERKEELVLNFGGKSKELWCPGGEADFVKRMIHESASFKNSVTWFSTLISKQTNLKGAYQEMEKVGASCAETLAMGQGNKVSRIVAWSFTQR